MIGFFGIGFLAGPEITEPSVILKCESWHEQSISPGVSNTSTGQPSCVHRESKPTNLPAVGCVTMYSSVSKSIPLLTGMSVVAASGVSLALTSLAAAGLGVDFGVASGFALAVAFGVASGEALGVFEALGDAAGTLGVASVEASG